MERNGARFPKLEPGYKNGMLTVVSFSHTDEKGYRVYNVKCECGTVKQVQGRKLKPHQTVSCGCQKNSYFTRMNTLPDNRGPQNKIYHRYKANARRRNVELELSYEQINDLVLEPCYYCGNVGSNNINGYRHNGIDRIDSSKGYTLDNVVPCCKICNRAKSDMPVEEFKAWATKLNKLTGNGRNGDGKDKQ